MEIIKRAVLSNTLLLGGVNLHMDLDTEKRTGLRLLYDDKTEMLLVNINKGYAKVPREYVAHMIPEDTGELEAVFASKPVKATPPPTLNPMVDPPKKGRVSAQVSGPHDHVFAGQGAGKTNDKK